MKDPEPKPGEVGLSELVSGAGFALENMSQVVTDSFIQKTQRHRLEILGLSADPLQLVVSTLTLCFPLHPAEIPSWN